GGNSCLFARLETPQAALAEVISLGGHRELARNSRLEMIVAGSRPMIVTEEPLFARTGSSSTASAVAVLTMGPNVITSAVTVRVANAPLVSVPTVQMPW